MNWIGKLLPCLSGHRVKVPMVFQMEATECGAACLGMVLRYYHCYEPLEKLRVACGVSRNGSFASLIIKAAATYGLKGRGFKVTLEGLDSLPLPAILFWDFNHFVIYAGRRGKHYYLNDPAMGLRKLSEDEFADHFTGVALTFEKTPDFKAFGRERGMLARLIPLLGQVKGNVWKMLWIGILLILPGVVLPVLTQVFVDDVMQTRPEWLVPLIILYMVLLIIQFLLTWLENLLMRRTEVKMAVNSTMNMLVHMFKLPMEFFQNRSAGDLQNRVALNRSVANSAFGTISGNAVKMFTATFFLVMMVQFSPFLSAIAVATAILNFLALSFVNKRLRISNQRLIMVESQLLNFTATGISMMENLRAGGREDEMFSQWGNYIADYADKRRRMQSASTFFSLLPNFLFGLNNVLILCFGAWLVMRGELSLGGMLAFQMLMVSFMTPVNALVGSGAQIQMLRGAIDRVDDVYKYDGEKRFKEEDGNTCELTAGAGMLEMRGISFGYNRYQAPLLEDFNLILKPGTRVALVGASGSGKSTVAKLAAGLITPWSGEILIDGQPLESYSSREFYHSLATVDQSIMLFSGSVRDNLTLFRKRVNQAELNQALRDAAIEGELLCRGTALDVPVNEMGSNFSGGQRQRLEIARALAKSTPILILDEATSALDPITEVMIDKAIRRRGCSCLIIAHRLSTIRDCDEIIMMQEGRILERGTHEQLMEAGNAYASLMRFESYTEEVLG